MAAGQERSGHSFLTKKTDWATEHHRGDEGPGNIRNQQSAFCQRPVERRESQRAGEERTNRSVAGGQDKQELEPDKPATREPVLRSQADEYGWLERGRIERPD